MIRRAQASDIPQVAALYHSVWHETQAPLMPPAEVTCRSVKSVVDRMTALLQSTLVTESRGNVVGFSAWQGGLLGQLFVAKSHRGTTIASNLLRTSELEMAKEGTAEAELRCVVGNERARRFYERMGWRHEGTIMMRVGGDHDQADVPFWRMTKVLAASGG
jgi:GNAT superfamily N-acetyltransferase